MNPTHKWLAMLDHYIILKRLTRGEPIIRAISSFDYFGNVVQHTRMIGKFELPIISKTWGLNPAMIKNSSDVNKLMEAS